MLTIKDIAARCGVSVSTVSRVINKQPYVREEVREKVQKVLDEEHFIVHSGAVGLVKPNGNEIGLIIRGISNPFFAELLPLLTDEITRSGFRFSLRGVGTDEDEIAAAAELAKSRALKGVIFLGGRFDYTPEEIALIGAPFVLCTFTNSFGTLSKEAYSSVSIDDAEVSKACIRLLLENGHRNILLLSARREDHSISELRVKGYEEALKEGGVSSGQIVSVYTESFDMEVVHRAVSEMILENVPFTAIAAISDTMAVAAIKALSDAGKRVPEDCSVIGIDGIGWSRYIVPELTTMVQPKEELARQTVLALQKAIENGTGGEQISVEAYLRRGRSVRRID